MTRVLPAAMLCAQFPLEGLLARIALRNHVTASGMMGRLLLFHLLAATELWLLSGALEQILAR